MTITAIRTVIIYIFLIVAMRVMGKRQLGELQPVELVVTLLISDLAAVPMQETGMPLLNGLIPILILVSLELLLSGCMLKFPPVARLISGKPVLLIRDGTLDQRALKKLRLTIEDLSESLRLQNIFDIRDVAYALAETNGQISILPKPDKQPATCGDVGRVPPDVGLPMVIISDGKVSAWGMRVCAVDRSWLGQVLADNACTAEEVFLLTANRAREYFLVRRDDAPKGGAAS